VGNQPHRENGEGLAFGVPFTHCVSRRDETLSRSKTVQSMLVTQT